MPSRCLWRLDKPLIIKIELAASIEELPCIGVASVASLSVCDAYELPACTSLSRACSCPA